MRNLYPADCQRTIDQFSPLAACLAAASGLTLDDLRQEIALAWLAGDDPARSVPRSLGVRRLQSGRWVALDPAVYGGEFVDEVIDCDAVALPLRDERGSLTRGIATDGYIGLRAAQKRLKRQRDAAAIQGDLFGRGEF